jgi:hypothetical protein
MQTRWLRTPHATLVARVSDVPQADLVSALLDADAAERERLLRTADRADLESALSALGHRREPAAAEVLSLVDLTVDDRALKKAARRELHRLQSSGVHMPVPPVRASEPAAAPRAAHLPVTQAWATDIDPTGARALWVLGEPPLGGVWFSALLLNDLRGLLEMNVLDTTRKRFNRDLEESRRGAGTWVSLPGEYALRLVREAVDLTREVGGGLPTRYRAFRDLFGEAPAGPERALIYETISPVEASFNPEWLDESVGLVGEPEIAGWHVPVPPELRARTLEVARGPAASLLVPGHTPEQQALQLLAESAQQTFTPLVRRGVRRRLEETAYVFVSTDRLAAARRAVAAARALEDANLPADRHPLVRLLLAAGLARLIGGETVGSRRASDVLLELIERASQPREGQQTTVETRPSGLILPR